MNDTNPGLGSALGKAGSDACHRPKILLVEDNPNLSLVYTEYLKDGGFEPILAGSGSAAMACLEQGLPDAMLLDLQLPDVNGLDLLRSLSDEIRDKVAIILITAYGSLEVAVDAIRAGAVDFLEKPFQRDRLLLTVNNALKARELSETVERIKATRRSGFQDFIGESLPMQAVYQMIENAAPSRAPVFITGESGTGKELCARAIHACSERSGGPLVAINCAAIPRELIESEIFGHVKGAFTGAARERAGAVQRADGGTLFLDELCEMDKDLQAKLLRFIQTGEFQRVGASRTERVDVRFVCATNRDPLAEVRAGRFREDLFYRLHVIPIQLPPLRERGKDVVLIAHNLLQAAARDEGKPFERFSPQAEQLLMNAAWSGNVRELQNLITLTVVMNDGVEVSAEMLQGSGLSVRREPGRPLEPNPAAPAAARTRSEFDGEPVRPLHLVEREAIESAIAHFHGNVPRAAAALELNPSTLYRKLKKWEDAA